MSEHTPPEKKGLSRREFIIGATATAAACAALTPLVSKGDEADSYNTFQKHFKKLSGEEKQAIFQRIEAEMLEERGVSATITDPAPMDGVEFAYVLNIGRCIGCRKCVYACMKENNTSRDPQIQYIRVLKMNRGAVNLESASHDYPEDQAGDRNFYYMPVQCQQCRNPPCVKVCPVKATWQEPDGLVVIDYNWCIGCRYCEAACPYHARRFNFAPPTIDSDEINPNMGYLSNRLRTMGVMEKCTFCLHRTREGRYPACVEVCPAGARKFGNLRDPYSEVRRIIENQEVFVLKKEVGTKPRFYYVFEA